MSWADTYKDLVNQLELTITDVPNTYDYLKSALNIVIDITNDDSSGLGTEATIFFLPRFNDFVLWSKWNVVAEISTKRKKIVKDMNDFTIRNYGDLTNFINSLDWDNGCAPVNWANISDDLGYDTSEWIICS